MWRDSPITMSFASVQLYCHSDEYALSLLPSKHIYSTNYNILFKRKAQHRLMFTQHTMWFVFDTRLRLGFKFSLIPGRCQTENDDDDHHCYHTVSIPFQCGWRPDCVSRKHSNMHAHNSKYVPELVWQVHRLAGLDNASQWCVKKVLQEDNMQTLFSTPKLTSLRENRLCKQTAKTCKHTTPNLFHLLFVHFVDWLVWIMVTRDSKVLARKSIVQTHFFTQL